MLPNKVKMKKNQRHQIFFPQEVKVEMVYKNAELE